MCMWTIIQRQTFSYFSFFWGSLKSVIHRWLLQGSIKKPQGAGSSNPCCNRDGKFLYWNRWLSLAHSTISQSRYRMPGCSLTYISNKDIFKGNHQNCRDPVMCALTLPGIRHLHVEICFEDARISNCKIHYFLKKRRSPEGACPFQKTGLMWSHSLMTCMKLGKNIAFEIILILERWDEFGGVWARLYHDVAQ